MLTPRTLVPAIVMTTMLMVVPRVARAQADKVDVGSFSIFRNGQRAGREAFSVRRTQTPDGGAFELRSESTIGERRIATRLETDSGGSPIRYSVEIRDGAAVAARIGGQRVRGRFATLARRDQGEAAREYLLQPGALVLETETFHQVGLMLFGRKALADVESVMPILMPLDNASGEIRVRLDAMNDTVSIAGRPRPSRRWVLIEKSGLTRMVWTDQDGRVLRVSIPSRSLEAIRDDVPR